MTSKSQTSSALTQLAASRFSRRSLLRGAAMAGTAAAIGPWLMKSGRASSGEVNLYTWSDYVYPDMVADFEGKTGITLNVSTYGTNDEVFNAMKASNGEGFDLIGPSITRVGNYVTAELLAALDESKLNVAGVIPSMWASSADLGGVSDGKRYGVPFNWGTEAIAFDSAAVPLEYANCSYGTLWDDANKGKVTVRAHSGMLGLGLYLDATGQVPSNRMLDTYLDDATMRPIYEQILAVAVEKKEWIGLFWNNAQETEAAFKQNGCVIGQTWDGPAFRMRNEPDSAIRYLAPKEGALTWMDGLAMPRGAVNLEQAYAFINWYYTPEAAALHIKNSGYNSCTNGADKLAGEDYARNFAEAYPGDAIPNLWWYPPEPDWFVTARTDFRDRWLAA